ncbi:EAL domain-containing protein [Dyella sp. EPa41]|uniref:bifunctional diguanylate cyclase/phosphodiesterase n=1 Tax=Dyella sp. EPa41 TaxID=1561194 RepID=UPI001916675A|nr:EAL domain-containing protein [Dyella sp. EPa41]
MKAPPKIPSPLAILLFGVLTAVLLLAAIINGLRSDLHSQLEESGRRADEVARNVAQAVRLPLRTGANAMTFIAEESARLQRTAPEQGDVLIKGLVTEILGRQPQMVDITFLDVATPGDGAAPSMPPPRWTLCAARASSPSGAPCFGPITRLPGGLALSVAAPVDGRRWVTGDISLSALERAVENVPHGSGTSFKVVDEQGRPIAQGGNLDATPASADMAETPSWTEKLFKVHAPSPLVVSLRVEPYPFKVIAHTSRQAALAAWHRHVAVAAAFYALYLLVFAGLLGVMYRATRMQRYYIRHLVGKTQELHAAQRVGRTAIWSFHDSRFHCTDESGELFGLSGGRCTASAREFLALVLPRDRPALARQARAAWKTHGALHAEFQIRKSGGAVRHLSARGQVVVDDDGTKKMTGTVVDVTEQWEARRRHAESEHRFRTLFDHNPLAFWVFDAATLRFLEVNAEAVRAYGYTRDEFLRMTIHDIRDPDDRRELAEHLGMPSDERTNPQLWVHRTKDGRAIDVRIHAADIEFNGVPARLIMAEDVRAELAGEREVMYHASHDLATGLPNQHALLSRMDTLVANGREFGIAYIQLLGMDAIADTFGIQVATGTLQAMAARLSEGIGPDEFLAAINQEAFAWMASGELMTEVRLRWIVQCVAEPLFYEDTQHQIDIVVGTARHPDDAVRSDVLLGCAALAAHAHIRSDRPIHGFEPSLARDSRERLHFAANLRRAVNRHEFELHFQPITDYPGMRLIGLEALIRWPQPDGTFIPPSTFIPLCEESGLIVPLGQWVLNQVAKAATRLADAGFRHLPIGINVSPAELRNGDLVANLRAARTHYALEGGAIYVELTESCLIEHRDKAIDVMRKLRDEGIAIALDDFGTGFSSLSYLRDLPIDMLKIDQGFIRDVDRDARSATICEAIISLGKSLGIRVMAEGIERSSQYEWLHRHGCDGAQGFYLGRPEPLAELLKRWPPASLPSAMR